jgi:hypothetical protein
MKWLQIPSDLRGTSREESALIRGTGSSALRREIASALLAYPGVPGFSVMRSIKRNLSQKSNI